MAYLQPLYLSSHSPTDIDVAETKQAIQFYNKSFMRYDSKITQYPEEAYVLTSIAKTNIHKTLMWMNEHAECILQSATINTFFSIPNFPLPMPEPNGINYQILPTPNNDLSMYALCDIQKGNLILAEWPVIFIPTTLVLENLFPGEQQQFDWDKFVQLCFKQLMPEN